MNRRRNVLVLMSDEHRADVSGFSGNDVIRTPTLDWLAESGTVFDNAYTPSPICVPARQCILAGQYPRTCGCDGWVGLPDGYMTYARRFGQYGYQTVAFGKLHLLGPDQLKGWQLRPVGDVACGQVEGLRESFFDGFQSPQDDRLNVPSSMKWSDEKELRRAGPGRHTERKDELAVLGAEDWIDDHFVGTWYDRQLPERPVMLYVGLHNPHYPYQCDERRFRYYLPRVRGFEAESPLDHPFLGKSAWPQVALQAGKDVPARAVVRARAAYYGKVETMDAHYGRVLDALRFAGEDLDEWIIVYCSDHGDQLGEHGVWEKQKFYEGSARVPLVIRAPGLLPQGARIDANVSLCDMFATLCDLAGLETPEGLDSRSLLPLATGAAMDWPDEACSFFLQQGYSNVMIKQGPLKYQWYEHEEQGRMPEVLFDLAKDPLETVNFIDEPDRAGDLARFRRRLTELGYGPAVT
ncbi:MAG: sulfatase-like hydrolase/transferase [Phycisphaeraceae bacterium]|nr:sulfatase-like hydrolase/transferase [Phycisphaeraceae bacterium]